MISIEPMTDEPVHPNAPQTHARGAGGFTHALFVGRDFSHIALSYVITLYTNTPAHTSMVADHLRTYAAYAPELMDRVQFVIVDDASPCPPEIPRDLDLNILVVRVREDIRWNQAGARNLGIVYARSDKVFISDADHLVPEATMRKLVGMRDCGRTMYRFARINEDGTYTKPHDNTYLLSRGRYLELFGNDEQFAGHYGDEDNFFWRWQRYHGTRFIRLPRRYPIQHCFKICGAYHTLTRERERNAALYRNKRAQMTEHGPHAAHARSFLEFAWDLVHDLPRERAKPKPRLDRVWIKAWWFRFVAPVR